MSGIKACAVQAWARTQGCGFLSFDYAGHGLSSEAFEHCTLSTWRQDTLEAIDALTDGPLVLVGSSMGGWLALLAALVRPERCAGLVLIAPAPDFTERLFEHSLNPQQRATLHTQGHCEMPSEYGDSYMLTRALIDDAKQWKILGTAIAFEGPVRILQGMADEDVPWLHAQQLVGCLTETNVVLTLVRDGDHRLSRTQDIQRLLDTCHEVAAEVSQQIPE
ncbi:MAG: alpha/beta fold hydrolase [Haliea sp.]|nr:alpha/beta fold hydrolase [Haliea sp.]MDP5064241.1 alpha/beta fold hydrolase [Haliea sp.]